jgi:hypothetical protein
MASAETPEVPESFLCPITCALMEDPVVDAHGHTYERQSIEQVCVSVLECSVCDDSPRSVPLSVCTMAHMHLHCVCASDCRLSIVA